MRSEQEILALLDRLDEGPAEDLEDQDLDFKEWDCQSLRAAVDKVVHMAVCMANGGGGTVVFGVADRVRGRARAIKGVPGEIDINLLKKAVYDRTDPKLTPVFSWLEVPEGTGRLLLMQVWPGLPPYTDTTGYGTIRVGKDCQPLTGSMRRRVMVETGESDITAQTLTEAYEDLLSPIALEKLRDLMRGEAPSELTRLSEAEFVKAVGIVREGKLTLGGLLLIGKPTAIAQFVPAYNWAYRALQSETAYQERAEGTEAWPVAYQRLLELINARNPIMTVPMGMFHFEYRTYPEIALREALMNAFCHADFRLASPILVKQFAQRLEISNPGGFIGGVTPDNILHHPPVARNPYLVEVMSRLRLVNRSNLGVSRIYEAFLVEGKKPPLYEDLGEVVRITMLASVFSPAFRAFVMAESERGIILSVDQIIVLNYLLRHVEIETQTAARLCQLSEERARELLGEMEQERGYLERGGTGRGTYYTLRRDLYHRLFPMGHPERGRRIDLEAAKTRILSVLRQREERGEPGLSNQEIRAITYLDRAQVQRLMRELKEEGLVLQEGERKGTRYRARKGENPS